jgi:hypothetical protein
MKTPLQVLAIASIGVILCFVDLRFSETASAQQNTTVNKNNDKQGFPNRRIGGGTRGNCYFSGNSLTALIPEKFSGTTASKNPQLFFYVPATKESKKLEFVLRDSQDNIIYEKIISTQGKEEIIGIDLPDFRENSVKSSNKDSVREDLLQINETYHWYASLICQAERRSQDLVVEGNIKRIELERQTIEQKEQLSGLELVEFYQKNQLWYDALATVAKLKQTNGALTNSLAELKWQEMLTSIGLNYIQKNDLTFRQ